MMTKRHGKETGSWQSGVLYRDVETFDTLNSLFHIIHNMLVCMRFEHLRHGRIRSSLSQSELLITYEDRGLPHIFD